MRESQIEDYLVRRVKAMGGAVRKVKWIGRSNAPDRLVMLPYENTSSRIRLARTIWAEVKNPETILTFPANAHERAQAREHQTMRDMGQYVVVVGTLKQVDDLLA